MIKYLEATEIVDYNNKEVHALALKTNRNYDEMVKNFPDIKEELCQCTNGSIMVMMSRYNENPLVCLACNNFISPEGIDIDVTTTAKLQQWRAIYDSIDRLWLESGAYETWAVQELSNPKSSLHKQGFEVQTMMQNYGKCYYWWFQDISKDEPLKNCPKCHKELEKNRTNLVCEKCLLVM